MYLSITQVVPLENYLLKITFQNKEEKLFDMKPYLNRGIFTELKDKSMFNTVRISFDSIEWDNEADLDPEFLYEYSQKI